MTWQWAVIIIFTGGWAVGAWWAWLHYRREASR